MVPISALQQKEKAIQLAWSHYQALPSFDNFVEFALLLNSLTDFLIDKSLTGLLHASRQLEQQALALFGDEASHPVSTKVMEELSQRVARLGELLRHYAGVSEMLQERREQDGAPMPEAQPVTAHVSLIGEAGAHWEELVSQLGYFGISVHQGNWEMPTADDADDSVFLVDLGGLAISSWLGALNQLRERRPLAQIICLGVPEDFVALDRALRAGADHCLTQGTPLQRVVGQVLERNGSSEQDPYRVLVVEDSRTAARVICRSLEENGIATRVLHDPSLSLAAIRQFQPDLILMDMYMPCCTGVEAARVIRQHDEFLSIPIVYLSGETDIGLQVDALRLGGDHFLTKPFNPVVMNAVVKSKIDRYRALRRSMLNDSLTGLLNHTSTKQALAVALEAVQNGGDSVAVAMLDIDHFKGVNDSHGHPVGDQVIRSLAWLLKQRLRRGDIVGRYGGEEFVLGLVGVSPVDAKEILDRIREDFSRISFSVPGGSFRVTYSAGVAACLDCQPHCLESLLEAADEALYEAKRQGRNQVVLAGHLSCCQPHACLF
ncbi:diguanylate cyclase [Azovibrio restrictus]|uniref:GGDEF domain-containing response regulator n=1 Tax=Azovibrio restrictus TaxID=146938 RepID=UPI0026F040BB|nr:diguanylate cyclase [Azovibrio restrictus]MDD3482211.1 diguanylate cyclase [Azovibrio restrictus]